MLAPALLSLASIAVLIVVAGGRRRRDADDRHDPASPATARAALRRRAADRVEAERVRGQHSPWW